MKILTAVALCLALGSASARTTSAADEAMLLISTVQHLSASDLDPVLPHTSLEEWLRVQVGKDARIVWAVRTGEGHELPWVEADISTGSRPGIVIMIACGQPDAGTHRKPKFKSLQLVRKDEFAEWPHLHDLPAAMKEAGLETQALGAMFLTGESNDAVSDITNRHHTEWIEAVLKATETIKVGMTRSELLKVFKTEGGLSWSSQRTYVYRECPYIKIDVKLAALSKTEELPNDKIVEISRPYLASSVMD